MVLLVLSAMASTSKLLYPYLERTADTNAVAKYREISKYILLHLGTPANWGESNQTTLSTFGLANAETSAQYNLDPDKVSRLNDQNEYALDYAEAFSALGMPDVSFRIEIKPVFEVTTNLTAIRAEANQTVYTFEIWAEKHGRAIAADLMVYVVAEDFAEATDVSVSDGRTYLNVTLSNAVGGPAVLVAFARSSYDRRLVSFGICPFAHNSASPKPNRAFVSLSPLNHTLTALFVASDVTMSTVYAFTYGHDATLVKSANGSNVATYNITHFAEPCPTLIVVTGHNSTTFFTEQVAYPHVPVQFGAYSASAQARSDVFAFTYLVSIGSAIYDCTLWIGGLRT
jgi:hypothetical protein